MLRFSQRSEYAVQALMELSLRGGTRTATIADVAGARHLPRNFLGAILSQLRQVGLVESSRGTRGGYRLARPAHRITVGQIVRLVEGPIEARGGDRAGQVADSAGGESVLAGVLGQASAAVQAVLERVTLADLVERENSRRAALAGSYTI